MTRFLAAILLLVTVNANADQIEINKPEDVCLSGVCIFDDISKFPSAHKSLAKYIAESNSDDACQISINAGAVIGAREQNVVMNNNKLILYFGTYVKDGKISARVHKIVYGNEKLDVNTMNEVYNEYISKYSNLQEDRNGFVWRKSPKTFVSINEPVQIPGGYIKVDYWDFSNENQLEKNAHFASKPKCNIKPKI